jgi:hypothetical protein
MKMEVRLNNNIPIAADATLEEVGMAMYQVGERVMLDSKENYVPIVTGELRRSGFVDYPKADGVGRIEVVMGYGRDFPARNYAVEVHEAPPEYGQGKRKYLTQAVFHNVPQIPGWIAASVAAAMSRRSSP